MNSELRDWIEDLAAGIATALLIGTIFLGLAMLPALFPKEFCAQRACQPLAIHHQATSRSLK